MYRNSPFSILNPKQRGEALQEVAQLVYEEVIGPITHPSRSFDFWCVTRRRKNRSEVCFDYGEKSWQSQVCLQKNQKSSNFTIFCLVFLFPSKIEFYLVDNDIVRNMRFDKVGTQSAIGVNLTIPYKNEEVFNPVGELLHSINFLKSAA